MKKILISPSILAGDFSQLGKDIQKLEIQIIQLFPLTGIQGYFGQQRGSANWQAAPQGQALPNICCILLFCLPHPEPCALSQDTCWH